MARGSDFGKCQTFAASPAEPGELPLWFSKTVAADPRFRNQDLGDLIADLISSCVKPVRAMIDACDHYFGQGAGEPFFYLDVLPNAVIESAVKPE